MRLIDVKPPQLAWLLLAVGGGVHFLLPPRHRDAIACPLCGGVLIAAGFLLMIWAWRLFQQQHTPIRPTDRAVTLVTAGPFRLSRNPMYLGITLMLLGISLVAGSPALLIAPIGFLVLMSAVFIPFEENRLREAFGETYERYIRDVRRWL
jgi:protein-S-isoprenylcysteine O-methyltransferase Ste14